MVRHRLQHEPLPGMPARVHLLRHAQRLLRDRGHRPDSREAQRTGIATRRAACPAEKTRHDRHGVDERPLHARRARAAADPPGTGHDRRRAFPGACHHQELPGGARCRHPAGNFRHLRGGEFHRDLCRRRAQRPHGTRRPGLFGAVPRNGGTGCQGHLYGCHDDAAAAADQRHAGKCRSHRPPGEGRGGVVYPPDVRRDAPQRVEGAFPCRPGARVPRAESTLRSLFRQPLRMLRPELPGRWTTRSATCAQSWA